MPSMLSNKSTSDTIASIGDMQSTEIPTTHSPVKKRASAGIVCVFGRAWDVPLSTEDIEPCDHIVFAELLGKGPSDDIWSDSNYKLASEVNTTAVYLGVWSHEIPRDQADDFYDLLKSEFPEWNAFCLLSIPLDTGKMGWEEVRKITKTDGLKERLNRTLIEVLSIYVSDDHIDWD
ncbi:uncharacterized protein LOC125945118 [Dermacentor silvarum]|uniref:uncharacterized protein LOC125945118 n=1 Tax=Dermacentor silvarum TaxID=543639 RepID=UPI002100A915|nr:uncharacterized protein LOC125945118 [Dermacentor silvarum]